MKSAAFVQSWHQTKLSSIAFVTPKTRAWDADTNIQSTEAKRQADVYVFALVTAQDHDSYDPLDVRQWSFWVLSRQVVEATGRKSLALSRVRAIAARLGYRPILW